MNGRIFFWSLTSALAGFLFGFDTVVISGAEKTIQSLWGLSAGLHGVAMASALYGTVVGSLLGGWPADRFGRKATLLWIGILYFVGAVCSGLASNVGIFIAARVIGGLGIGISTVVAPMYISEIAPPKYRGRLAGMFQFNIVFGILIAFVSNALLAGIGENAWRWMLGVAAFPSLLYAVFCFGLPESPRWLLGKKGDREAGLQVLQRIEPDASKAEVAAEADAIIAASSEQASSGHFWTRRLRKPIMLAILIAFFNQLSGINAILYFAPRIFELTGLAIALLAQQPAWTFGKAEAEYSVEQRRKRSHTQHPAPGVLAAAGEQRVRDESHQDAKNNVELEHSGKSSTMLRRCDLRDVHWGNHRRDADSQPADDACDDENSYVWRQG